MRKIILFTTMILFLSITTSAMAQVTITVPPPPSVRVTVPLPPPIVFAAPPEVVVLPETEVYVAPSVPEEIFFYNGWWWRPWNGRWYRSLRYDSGWGFYRGVPSWYNGIPRGWRDDYRNHVWGGHPWNYSNIHHGDLQRNWRTWHNTHHWDRPEHRQFTHHHDGRLYHEGHDRGRLEGQHDKGGTQRNLGQKDVTGQHSRGQGQHPTGQDQHSK
jgi:hypothetical protein